MLDVLRCIYIYFTYNFLWIYILYIYYIHCIVQLEAKIFRGQAYSKCLSAVTRYRSFSISLPSTHTWHTFLPAINQESDRTTFQVRLWWKKEDPVILFESPELPDFLLDRYNWTKKSFEYPAGQWDQLKVDFTFRRSYGFYILQICKSGSDFAGCIYIDEACLTCALLCLFRFANLLHGKWVMIIFYHSPRGLYYIISLQKYTNSGILICR